MPKCHRLEGKVAIVTAASKGIGLAIAERLGQEGAAVVICSRSQKNVDEAVRYLRSKGIANVVGIAGHIADRKHQQELVDSTIRNFHKIDILINNHGINPAFGNILDVDDKVWDKLFEVNVKAGWQLTKLVHPYMARNGGGNIVFNASFGAYKSPPGIAAYAVTKTTLLGLTKALAHEMAKDKIRVNAIAPGIIKTKMSQALWDGNGEEGEQEMVGALEIPLGRLGIPEDCAGAVAFLASDDSKYITGETILIAGGIHARLAKATRSSTLRRKRPYRKKPLSHPDHHSSEKLRTSSETESSPSQSSIERIRRSVANSRPATAPQATVVVRSPNKSKSLCRITFPEADDVNMLSWLVEVVRVWLDRVCRSSRDANTLYTATLLLFQFCFALFVSLVFPPIARRIALPSSVENEVDLNLSFDTCTNELHGICSFPSATVEYEKETFFSPSVAYALSVRLRFVDIDQGRRLGFFQNILVFYDEDKQLKTYSKTSYLKEPSLLTKALWLFFFPLYFAGFFHDYNSVEVSMTQFHTETTHSSTKLLFQLQDRFAQVEKATLVIRAQFGIIRYLLYNWPVTTYLILFAFSFSACCLLITLYWGARRFPRSSTSHSYKAERLSADRQDDWMKTAPLNRNSSLTDAVPSDEYIPDNVDEVPVSADYSSIPGWNVLPDDPQNYNSIMSNSMLKRKYS